MMVKISPVIYVIVLVMISSCKSNENISIPLVDLPRIIIYKTRADHWDKVPVTLNYEKTMIVSYPGRLDIEYGDTLRLPVSLPKGYFIDNQGINTRSVFLSITYQDYREINDINPVELYKSIEDLDPFEEIYDCGPKKSAVSMRELKSIVRGGFRGCKRLK